ncbi:MULTISPECIES: RNA 3'-terminal phosphate cyclase [Dyella]|uniref:RNA 3'-terminal phosphate cyclase n=2 Tax=Dyella TaxID=231454 RepID=A0A4R0YJD1_9GAMM|nr:MULTISPECIES: RNA 3'-terminal phosphate cyclase [Dyella]TBR35880.1 RNA 3'-terminal phosphate cyclase [Dyella terrae]TCI08572.1 RNA 3'-terminal phosphate cyclase [Dyella soli]
MLEIDGQAGGGQLLRTALALSLCTGESFRMERIRAKRSRPGLMRQHLTAVQAARDVGSAHVEGAEPGSTTLVFVPGQVRGGAFHWPIGTAGSTTLVLQTVLPALWHAGVSAQLVLEGGTHNPLAPSADFLAESFLPLMHRMGLSAELVLERHGFYPAGGGQIRLDVGESEQPKIMHLADRGDIQQLSVTSLVSRIPGRVGEREIDAVVRRLPIAPEHCHIRQATTSPGPGNALSVRVQAEHVCEVFTAYGERGVTAERVGEIVSREALAYLGSGAAVGPYLADQLLLPMALAGAGSFTTQQPSDHAKSNAVLIEKFLPVQFDFDEIGKDFWRVSVSS